MISTHPAQQTAILVGVDLPDPRLWTFRDSLAELEQLATSAGLEVVGEVTQTLEHPNPTTFVGKGKAQELAELRKGLGFDLIVFDEELSPSQQRNLEDVAGVQVIDRTGLILDIFAQRARTHEGRLQVELAQYEYYLPRLTRMWTHLSRQTRGGVGLRGPGETQLESDRRRIRRRVGELRRQLEEVRTHRALHRQHRRREMMPVVALVGYTNAGKSTLLKALTGADVFVADKLFATLDPTTRRVRLPRGQEVLVSDTVGFIQKLPTQLVAAFRATLEELGDADVLVQVVDIAHPNAALQAQAVSDTLAELKLGDKPVVTALNKIDKLLPADAAAVDEPRIMEMLQQVAAPYPDAAAISASRGIGLEFLLGRIETVLAGDQVHITLLLPYEVAELAAQLRRQSSVLQESYSDAGLRLVAMVPRWLAGVVAKYAITAAP